MRMGEKKMSFDQEPEGDKHGECAAEIKRLESERDALAELVRMKDEALESAKLIRTASADGERLHSCCNSLHVNETLMCGDLILRVSYVNADKYLKATPAPRNEDETK